jgi:hypothetical protein
MSNKSFLFSACMFFLLTATQAHALCGDVTGDNKKTTADALAVLRSAVGQPVNLQCEAGPTEVRYFNDFSCSSGSSVSTLDFDGYEFTADADEASPFQTVDVHLVTEMHLVLCGGDYNFTGEQNLLPGRRYEAFMVLADPDVYTDVEEPAFLIFYDVGPSGDLLTTDKAVDARSQAGVMFGGKRSN